MAVEEVLEFMVPNAMLIMFELIIEAMIFGRPPLLLIIITIIFTIAFEPAFMLLYDHMQHMHEKRRYASLILIGAGKEMLRYHKEGLAWESERAQDMYKHSRQGEYMKHEFRTVSMFGNSRMRKRIGIISDVLYADDPAMKEHEGNRPATACMTAGGRTPFPSSKPGLDSLMCRIWNGGEADRGEA